MSEVEVLLDEWLAGQPCASPSCDGSTDDGQKCQKCGTIPAVTRPELQQEFEKHPLDVAEIYARRAIDQGTGMLDAAIGQIHQADRIRLIALLRLKRDLAQAALNEHALAHQEGVKKHQAAISKARRAEQKARRELQPAQDELAEIERQLDEARRYKHFSAELELTARARDAEGILARYKTDHAEAAAALATAVAPVEVSEKAGKQLEVERDKAVSDLDNPGPVGYGAEAITLGLMRLVEGGKLSGEEQLAAGQIALDAVSRSGVLEMLKTQVRAEVLAGQEEAAKGRPLMRGHTADGQPVALANPHNPATPQPYHPPTPGNQPHPVTPAVTPGWAT